MLRSSASPVRTGPFRALVASSALALALALGCGGTVATSAEGKNASCSDLCSQGASCGSDADIQTCTESCTESDILNRGAQEVISECAREVGCDNTNPVAVVDCLQDGIEDLEPSAGAETFCENSSTRLGECSGETQPPSKDECLASAVLFSDEMLAELNECFDKNAACQNLQLCLLLELGGRVDTNAVTNPEESDSFLGVMIELFGGLPDGVTLPGLPTGFGTPPEDDGMGGAPG